MQDLPSAVEQIKLTNIEMCPLGCILTEKNELIMLQASFQYISIYNVETFQEMYRIFPKNEFVHDLWYVSATDSLLLMERDQMTQKPMFRLINNWRPKNSSSNTISIMTPPDYIYPDRWHFKKINNEEITNIILSVFLPEANPTAQIFQNSIIIVSETAAIVWDLFDRPVLRFILMLPLPMLRPYFSFCGDRLAIVTNDLLFIIKIIAGQPTTEVEPFSPGSKCFELHDELMIDFGLTSGKRNFLFIAKYLPDRPINCEIMFEFRPPGELKHIHFLSKDTLLLLTNLAALACISNGKGSYDPTQLTYTNDSNNVSQNSNFIVLYRADRLLFYPNPEKMGLDINDKQVTHIDELKMRNINYVCTNETYCIIVAASINHNGVIYLLKFTDIDKITKAALASSDIEARKAAVRLMGPKSSEYALSCYDVGMRLIKKCVTAESIRFLLEAFNSSDQLSKEQRSSLLTEMLSLKNQTRLKQFIQKAHFKNYEIDDKLLKEIQALPPPLASLKLIKAHKFDCKCELAQCKESDLFKAISLSIQGNHEEARQIFNGTEDELLASLDDELLSQISLDLSPATLVRIEKPTLPNDGWSLNERVAALQYMTNDFKQLFDNISNNINDVWHFDEWPKVPRICEWVKGPVNLQFAAGLFSDNNITQEINEVFKPLSIGISLAKESKYSEAFDVLGKDIYHVLFLKHFATKPQDWINVYNQITDEEIRQIAAHFLIATSPTREYYKTVKNIPNAHGLTKILDQLREADKTLLEMLAV